MFLHVEAQAYKKARTAGNSTDAAYPARPPTITEPADDGVINTADLSGAAAPDSLIVIPYVLGANNNTFSCRVIGWSQITLSGVSLWIPEVLAEYDCTAGNIPGVAASPVLNTEFLPDTLSLVANMGTDAQGTTKVSPQDDTPGHFVVKTRGARKVEFLFKKGTGTSANALYRGI